MILSTTDFTSSLRTNGHHHCLEVEDHQSVNTQLSTADGFQRCLHIHPSYRNVYLKGYLISANLVVNDRLKTDLLKCQTLTYIFP